MTEALVDKYFHMLPGGPVFRGSTDVTPLADGVAYFDALDAAIAKATGPGDRIYILAWRLDAAFDLRGRTGPEAVSLAELLAAKQVADVDVRVVLWTGSILGDPGKCPIGTPMQDNVRSAMTLRNQLAPGSSTPPLAERVLLDWSGADTGSHHMKGVLVVSGGGTNMVAFCTGIDPWKYRLDSAPHTQYLDPADGSPFGWHDAAIRLEGAAAQGVYDTFADRWREASTLPPKRFRPSMTSVDYRMFNPPAAHLPFLKDPAPAPVIARPQQAVQILRSRYEWKYDYYLSSEKKRWDGPVNTGGYYEVFETLKKAILAARRYIYIEDQYLGHSPSTASKDFSLFSHLAAVAVEHGVKLIFVGSGRGDPDDPPGQRGPTNQTFSDANEGFGKTGPKRLVADVIQSSGMDPAEVMSMWRLRPATVHSKLMIIDDRFLAIGSANLHSRSMVGEDSELHVAVVDEGNLIREFRIMLWSEHFGLPGAPRLQGFQAALEDLDIALGLWRSTWLPPASVGTWIVPDRPPGFLPGSKELEFVGP